MELAIPVLLVLIVIAFSMPFQFPGCLWHSASQTGAEFNVCLPNYR